MAAAGARLVVLDVPSLVHRAYHAVPQHFSTADGEPTNAVYGFVIMLLRVIDDLAPDHVAAAFDLPGPTFRHERYEPYKANREAPDEALARQFGRVEQVIRVLGIPTYAVEGYEADDILGTLADRAAAEGLDVYLVTGDRDAWQLVNDRVRVLSSNPRTGQPVTYDEAAVRDRWGIRPDQVTDFKGLQGDSSDNIPGVPGIGEKTASQLLGEYDTIEQVYEHLDDLKPGVRRRLEGQRDQALLSRELAKIVTDLPVELELDRTRLWQADKSAVEEMFRELQFRSLLGRMPFLDGVASDGAGADAPEVEVELIQQPEAATALANRLATAERAALFPVARVVAGLVELVGLAVACDGSASYLVCDNGADVLAPLSRWLSNGSAAKVAFDSKLVSRALAARKQPFAGVTHDLLLAAYVADPNATPKSLDDLAFRITGRQLAPPLPDVPAERGLLDAGASEFAAAAGARAAIALELADKLDAELGDSDPPALLRDIELPLVPVLAFMEQRGVALDVDALRAISRRLQSEIAELEGEIHRDVGHQFNINSPKQLGDVLFGELGLPPGRRTKSGYSTASGVLEELVGAHPAIQRVLDFRALTKLKSTYVDALPELVNPATGRLHTTFNQAVAATGRLSSANPNLQNIPIRTERGREIRRAFVAGGDDSLLLSVDYSQIELRVLAHASEDPAMCEAFAQGQDIHAATAARLNDIPIESVTGDMRRLAKTTNFGIVYGISAQGLAQRTELSNKEAADFIESYFATYPGVKAYMDRTIHQAHERGYVEAESGRRRYLPGLKARAFHERAAAERMAINMPIQGAAADIIKIAMINLWREIRSRDLASAILLQVHDELLFEVPREELDMFVPLAKTQMRDAVPLRVPVDVDAKVGANWRDMTET